MANEKIKLEEAFFWKKFPYLENRLSVLVIYKEPKGASESQRALEPISILTPGIKHLLDIFPDPIIELKEPIFESIKLEEKKYPKKELLKREENKKLKVPGMRRILATKINTKQVTFFVDISSVKTLNSFKTLENFFEDNTHMLCIVDIKSIMENYFELFDILIFVEGKDSSDYMKTRFNKEFNNTFDSILKDNSVLIDNREMYPIVHLCKFLKE